MRNVIRRLFSNARDVLIKMNLLEKKVTLESHSLVAHWFRSLFSIYDLDDMVLLDTPWWPYKVIAEIDRYCESNEVHAFEWGSGASTIWLSKRVASLTSIEHDNWWAQKLVKKKPWNSEIKLFEPEKAVSPEYVRSRKKGFENLDFVGYVSAIHINENTPNLIVIDGRARSECLAEALLVARKGCLILFDNSNRRRYASALQNVDDSFTVSHIWGLTPASPYPTRSSIIRKVTSTN